ncbi:hypothetical protein [Agathobacter rectalis]|uniref:Uncharacterized protein n=1 Tax=Agathobacter rectalis TaxID=39491 RepID=A0A2U2EFC3_9FIRM|nr:hypothetical protein [Agathobacter rectalis]PWE83210.1 hypothetical protein LD38_11620 [Agathobacter rectalis]
MEQRIADIDAKKKELYKEHARYKYQYEKDVDVEKLYMVDVLEFAGSEILYAERGQGYRLWNSRN